ncbi:MAG: hypothetical protein AAGJ18_09880 [Bacteroidota bacterium]
MSTFKNFQLLATLLLVTVFQFSVTAQKGDVLLTNSATFEVDQYKDIDGSPYLFEEWQLGKVISKEKDKDVEMEYLLNFNGYTKSFEVRKDQQFITLDEQYYSEIRVADPSGDATKTKVFKTNAHPIYKNRFMQVVFEGTDFVVLHDFQQRLNEREVQAYAGNKKMQEFTDNSTYHVIRDNKAKAFKTKKKSLLGAFKDQEGALKNYIKKNKLKIDDEKELIAFLRFYEGLNHPESPLALQEK